ncbi:MAG: hypothetical protein ACLR1T_10870 [Evtepia gabavorous]
MSLAEDEEGYRLTADAARTVGSETVVLTGFLRSELSPTGQVYQGIQYAENMGFYRYEFLAGAILGLVLGLLSLGFLLWSAGLRQEGSEEVSLRWMDRTIPTDLLIVAGAAVLLFGFLPVACSSGWGASLVAFGPTVLTMALMGVVLAMALSLVPPEARGNWEGEPVLPRLIRPVRRWGKALGRRTGELLGKLPLFWAAGLGFLLLCFLEGLCLMGCYYGGGWVVLWLLLKVLEGDWCSSWSSPCGPSRRGPPAGRRPSGLQSVHRAPAGALPGARGKPEQHPPGHPARGGGADEVGADEDRAHHQRLPRHQNP